MRRCWRTGSFFGVPIAATNGAFWFQGMVEMMCLAHGFNQWVPLGQPAALNPTAYVPSYMHW